MNPRKDETPKVAPRGFLEHKANAAGHPNHGAGCTTPIAFAQGPADAVAQARKPMTDAEKKALVRALIPLTSRVRTDVSAIRGSGGPVWTREALTAARLEQHVNGGPARGACPIKAGEDVTMVGLLDFDSHRGESTWAEVVAAAVLISESLRASGYEPVAFRSGGGNGIHLFVLWDAPQDAYSVRQALRAVVEACGFKDSSMGGVAAKSVEVFPKQDAVPVDGFGNQFFFPLAGRSEPLDLELGLLMGRDAALTLDWPMSTPVPVLERPERKVVVPQGEVDSPSKVLSALMAIPNDGVHPATPDYEGYRDLLYAVHEATGGADEGFDAAMEWSEQHPKHDEAYTREKIWEYIKPADKRSKAITRATLYLRAREHGWGVTAAPNADGFEEVPEADDLPAVLAQNLVDALRKEPRDTTAATWARRTADMPKDVGALVLDEVARLTGLGRRILAAALNDARRDIKREQRRKEVEQRAAKRLMLVYRPEDSVSQSRTIGSHIINAERPESMVSFGGCLSQIVDSPMAQAHHYDNDDADAPTTLHVRPHTQASMRALVEKHVLMYIETEQGSKPVAVPALLLEGLLELESADAPQLTGLLTHPIALSDGTILSDNGPHKRTGLFLSGVTGKDYRVYSKDEARAALHRIRTAILEGFEFASELDAAVAVAGLFTGVQRRLLDMAPGLAVLAAAQSSGKTTFLRIIHVILTGRDLPVTTLPIGNEAEVEKRLLSLLMQSPAVIAFDNIPDGFTVHSGSLSAAMTSSTFEGRVLGVSRMATVPTNVLIALTGNNLTFGADEISRWLVARLAPRQARPEERRFRHSDIVAHALTNRETVLRDVVGIVSGFINSGTTMHLSGTRFPKWDRMVRQPLLWAGAEDVARVFRINEGESEHAQALRGLLLVLHEAFGDRLFYAREVADLAQGWDPGSTTAISGRLRDALEGMATKDARSARSVGRILTAKSERTVTIDEHAGTILRLCRRVDRDGTFAYCISAAL